MDRAEDITAVTDQLTAWNGDESGQFHRRIDLKKIRMSGHSFGAVTTQAMAESNGRGSTVRGDMGQK